MPIELLLFFDTVDVRVSVRSILAQIRANETVSHIDTHHEAPHLRVVIRGRNADEVPSITPLLIAELERLTVPPPRQEPEPQPRDRGTTVQGVIEAFANDGGLNALRRGFAQSMILPLRRNIDYSGIGRRALIVADLPQGAETMFDPTPESIMAADEAIQRFAQVLNQLPVQCVVGARVVNIARPELRGTIDQIDNDPAWPLITVLYDEPQGDSVATQLSQRRFKAEWRLAPTPDPEPTTDFFDRLLDEDLF